MSVTLFLEKADFPEPIEQVVWSYSIGDTMNNFRDLVKLTIKTPSLREEFRKAKEEIINRVKDGAKSYDINKMTCVSTDWSKLGIGFLITQKHCDCPLENAPGAVRKDSRLSLLAARSAQVPNHSMLP